MATPGFAHRQPVLALLACLVLAFACAAPGALFPPGAWYAGIAKPGFTPPSWVFGPAWTTLYVLIAVATWLLWRAPASPARTGALRVHALQLALNAAWSPVFFGIPSPGAALVVIVAMWLAILATVVRAWPVRRAASVLLWPYLAWVGFATVLNATIWWLNR